MVKDYPWCWGKAVRKSPQGVGNKVRETLGSMGQVRKCGISRVEEPLPVVVEHVGKPHDVLSIPRLCVREANENVCIGDGVR